MDSRKLKRKFQGFTGALCQEPGRRQAGASSSSSGCAGLLLSALLSLRESAKQGLLFVQRSVVGAGSRCSGLVAPWRVRPSGPGVELPTATGRQVLSHCAARGSCVRFIPCLPSLPTGFLRLRPARGFLCPLWTLRAGLASGLRLGRGRRGSPAWGQRLSPG